MTYNSPVATNRYLFSLSFSCRKWYNIYLRILIFLIKSLLDPNHGSELLNNYKIANDENFYFNILNIFRNFILFKLLFLTIF